MKGMTKLWRVIEGKSGEQELANLGRELFTMAQRVQQEQRTQKDAHVEAYRVAMAKAVAKREQQLRALHMANAARHYASVKYQQQAGHTLQGKVIRPIPMSSSSSR